MIKLKKDNKKLRKKTLGKPLTGRFLALMIKNEILNKKKNKGKIFK